MEENSQDYYTAKINEEFGRAIRKFPPFNSLHEGWAVLREEMDELWDQVKKKQGTRDPINCEKECIQIAAMALRIIHDCGMVQDFQK